MSEFSKNLVDYLRDYSTALLSAFKQEDIIEIIYGSALEDNKSPHDVDICVIVPNCESSQIKLIADTAINLHLKYDFSLDFDVPYENKTLYSFSDVNRALSGEAFRKDDGKFEILPIEMIQEFLCSSKMKDRLLLNVLTTSNRLLAGDATKLNRLIDAAWETITRAVFSNLNNIPLSKEEFIRSLGGDNISGKRYKGYLGYDLDNISVKKHLVETVDRKFADFIGKNLLCLDNKGKYVCNEG